MLLPTALAIGVSALNEVVSIGRALAIRSEQRLDINQEFIGQGLANLIGSFFSGYVVSGSFNRSALNYKSGARSQMSAVFGGLILAAVLVFAAPLAAYLPHAAMAASLELVGWSLIDRKSLARIWRSGMTERGVLLATIGVALFIQIQAAILAGVVLSLVVYLYRTSNPQLGLASPIRSTRAASSSTRGRMRRNARSFAWLDSTARSISAPSTPSGTRWAPSNARRRIACATA